MRGGLARSAAEGRPPIALKELSSSIGICGEHGVDSVPLTGREKALFARAREYVATGLLPRFVPTKIGAGHGTGAKCSLCNNPIEPAEIEYEVNQRGGLKFRFHIRCHAIWQLAATAAD